MLQLNPHVHTKLGGEAESLLLPDVFLQEQIGSGGSGERTRFLGRSSRTLKAAEGQMLVQTSSPLHHCSSCSTNSLPPEVLQPETYPSSERPVKHPSRSPRQYTFWNCLHPRWYWAPGNCCKSANAPSHRPRRLCEVLQLTPTSLSLEPPTPSLDTDTAGPPNHASSTGALTTIARFANSPYPWTISHVAPPGYAYQHQPPQFSLSLPVTLPQCPYEACHRVSSLPHMRLRFQPAVIANVSQLSLQANAPDLHITHGRYRLFIGNPKQQRSTKRRPTRMTRTVTPGNRRRTLHICQ